MTETHDHPADHVHSATSAKEIAASRPDSSDPLEPSQSRGRLLFVDALSGLAGDMWVGALIDLGVPEAVISTGLRQLPLTGYHIHVQRVHKHSLAATQFSVELKSPQPSRNYADIRAMLQRAELPDGARSIAQRAFAILARAESQVHGVPVEAVHFHEVGAVDSIVDVIATGLALDYLGCTVIGSPVPLSRGFVRTAHGYMPLPAPATLLCLADVPTGSSGLQTELVTPTGACLLKAVAAEYASWPTFRPQRVGLGAGSRDLEDRPNVLRLVLGSEVAEANLENLQLLSANVDDMTPEWLAHALLRAQASGAVDTWVVPILMKKGRPAFTFHALVHPQDLQRVSSVLFDETTTLGLRIGPVQRYVRPRSTCRVSTPFGPVLVKVASGDGHAVNIAPEYESCRKAAALHSVPLKAVYAAALHAYLNQAPEIP